MLIDTVFLLELDVSLSPDFLDPHLLLLVKNLIACALAICCLIELSHLLVW